MNYFIMEVTKFNSKTIKPITSIVATCETAEKAIRLQKLHTDLHNETNPTDKNTEFCIVSKVEVKTQSKVA